MIKDVKLIQYTSRYEDGSCRTDNIIGTPEKLGDWFAARVGGTFHPVSIDIRVFKAPEEAR